MKIDDEDDPDSVFDEISIALTTPRSLTYVHTSSTVAPIVVGHAYRIGLSLCSFAGCSEYSELTSAVVAADLPDPATNARLHNTTNNFITVAWDHSGNHGGYQLLHWKILVTNVGATISHTALHTQTNLLQYKQDCNANGFAVSKDYLRFQIQAVNPTGASTATEVLQIRCSAVPDQPATPTTLASTSSSVTV